MTAVRARRAVLAALLLTMFVSPGGVSAAPAPAPAGADRAANRPSQEASTTGGQLKVVDQTQWVPYDGSFLLVLDVTGAPAGSRLTTSLHREVADRGAFLRSLFGADLGETLPSPAPVELDDIRSAGGIRRVPIVIALRRQGPSAPGQIFLSAGLGRTGAYPVQVRLVDRNAQPLAALVTHLVRLPSPDREVTPLTVSPLLGLHAAPTISPYGAAPLSDEALTDIAARVRAVEMVPDSAVTFVPTPETIEAMARTQGRPAQLLADLRDAVSRHQILDGPYVDLALTSWFDAGMDDELNRQRERGNAILTKQLASPDGSTWPASRELSTNAAAKLWSLGVRRLVLPAGSSEAVLPDGLPGPDGSAPTPTKPFEVRTALASPLQAVAVDDSLPGRFTFADDPQLAAHHLLTELAVIQGEAPEERRGVVLTPPPDWHASLPLLLTLFRGLAASPLLRPATIDGLFSSVPLDREGSDGTGPAVVRELTPTPSIPVGDYATDLAALRDRVTSYQGMVGQTAEVNAWLQRLLISGASDLTPRERDRYLRVIGATINARIAAIEAPRRQTVTLTAREGRIPLTLSSGLSERATVTIELETSRRLEFPDGDRVTVALDPGTEQVNIRVKTRSPGDSPLEIRLVSPDGLLSIDSTRLTVRSTAVSGIGTVLSVGAAAFLMLWWVRHWRRVRRARPSRQAAEPAPPLATQPPPLEG